MVDADQTLKVLQLFTQPWRTGGAESHLATLVSSLTSRKCEVVIVGIDEKLRTAFSEPPFFLLPLRSIVFAIPNLIALIKIVRRLNISVIHVHQRTGCVYAYLLRLGLHIPYIVTFHDKWSRMNRVYKPFIPDQAIAISEGVRNHFLNVYRIDPQNISVIPNGVALCPSPNMAIDPIGDPGILHVSRFTKNKGKIALLLCQVIQLLNQRFPAIRLALAGHGDLDDMIKRQVQATNLACGREAVFFLGEQNDIDQLLHRCTVAIGAGRFALEAMAAGKPVIAIADGEDFPGLIGPDNWQAASRTSWTRGPKQLALESMIGELDLLIEDRLLQAALGNFGRELVRDYFSSETMAEKVIGLYQNLIKYP